MLIKEFSKKYKLSANDASIVAKLHEGKDRTEKEWYDSLKTEVVIRLEYKETKKEKIEKIKEVKNKKNASSNKTDKQ